MLVAFDRPDLEHRSGILASHVSLPPPILSLSWCIRGKSSFPLPLSTMFEHSIPAYFYLGSVGSQFVRMLSSCFSRISTTIPSCSSSGRPSCVKEKRNSLHPSYPSPDIQEELVKGNAMDSWINLS
jgi:hypothetical protein